MACLVVSAWVTFEGTTMVGLRGAGAPTWWSPPLVPPKDSSKATTLLSNQLTPCMREGTGARARARTERAQTRVRAQGGNVCASKPGRLQGKRSQNGHGKGEVHERTQRRQAPARALHYTCTARTQCTSTHKQHSHTRRTIARMPDTMVEKTTATERSVVARSGTVKAAKVMMVTAATAATLR
jgi:hypothetical protein